MGKSKEQKEADKAAKELARDLRAIEAAQKRDAKYQAAKDRQHGRDKA